MKSVMYDLHGLAEMVDIPSVPADAHNIAFFCPKCGEVFARVFIEWKLDWTVIVKDCNTAPLTLDIHSPTFYNYNPHLWVDLLLIENVPERWVKRELEIELCKA